MQRSPQEILLATFLVQAAGALLTAAVFFSFQGYYKKGYLRHWTWGWLALAVMFAVAPAGLFLWPELGVAHPVRLSAAIVASVAGYLQLGWILLGTREIASGRPVEPRFARRILLVLAAVGILTAVFFTWDPELRAERFFPRIGSRGFTAGASFIAAAVWIWRARHGRPSLGHRLVTAAFFIHGLVEFFHFWLAAGGLLGGPTVRYHFAIGLTDLVLQFAMGLGMIIWLLEDERQATVEAAQQIQHLAFHDILTGLPNRQLFLDRLDHAIAHAHRAGNQLAVLFLDLDRFKIINDSLGHGMGDRLLQAVAQRMREIMRDVDTVTRIGGDEFTILAPALHSADDAITVARKVRDAIKHPFVVDGRELFISTSIGISMYPSDGDDPETLVKNADIAMYQAKAKGRDVFQLYTPRMNARALEQLSLETGLRRGVVNREFLVHYQPIASMETGRIEAMETVIRWRHPELGILPPRDFIVLAEATGLIVPIGEWVLRSACAQVKEWHDQGHPGLRVAINLSVRQLQQPDFVTLVSQILAGNNLPASSVEFEITESIAMQSDDGTIEKLRELKRMGMRISIDDFGTGYSSLSALRLFPVDTLKIDGSFVRDVTTDPDDAAIASAVIALAHSLQLTVIAEAVETVEQLDFLRAERCDSWQGYLFSAPVPVEECAALLAAQRGPATRQPVAGVSGRALISTSTV